MGDGEVRGLIKKVPISKNESIQLLKMRLDAFFVSGCLRLRGIGFRGVIGLDMPQLTFGRIQSRLGIA